MKEQIKFKAKTRIEVSTYLEVDSVTLNYDEDTTEINYTTYTEEGLATERGSHTIEGVMACKAEQFTEMMQGKMGGRG